jgi:hypothetical protein
VSLYHLILHQMFLYLHISELPYVCRVVY